MKILKNIGLILLILLGAYLSIWVLMIGGIVQVLEAVRAEHMSDLEVAIGVTKLFFCAFPLGISLGVVGFYKY